MNFDFLMPTELKFGSGKFNDISNIIKGIGLHAFIVTGKSSMKKLGYTNKLITALADINIKSTVYNNISSSPSLMEVEIGAKKAREVNADFVIGFGGGSVIDAAKAIAAISTGETPAKDYFYKRVEISAATLPIISIPTTAGTGSEMNRSAIIRDPDNNIKDGIRSNYLYPKMAIVDPELTHSLPKKETAETGFDVLTHAIESFVTPKAQPITDAFAIMAIKNILTHLPVVLSDPQNTKSREYISLSSALMGYNLSFVGTCFPHRVDKPLCAIHPEISHGQSLAVFYPYWAKLSWKGNTARFAELSYLFDKSTIKLTVNERAELFPELITKFIKSIGLKTNICDLGITNKIIPQLIEGAAGDLTINPVPIKKEDLQNIFENVFQVK